MTYKKETPSNLSIPVSTIGKRFKVTLGGVKTASSGTHFENINTPWLKEFLDEHELISPQQQSQTIQATLELQQEDSIFRCEAHIEFEPSLECARCLTRFRTHVTAQGKCFYSSKAFTDTRNQHSLSGAYNDEVCLSEEDMDAYQYQGNNLILDEFVLDTMLTNLPAFPLCHDTCRGLCLQCGLNLNETNHCERKGCETEFSEVH